MNREETIEARKKINPESREYFRSGVSALILGGACVVGAGISYCTNNRIDLELEKQYKNCQYFLKQAQSDEATKFVNDDIFVINGPYKDRTCREIFQEYHEAQKK